MRSCKACKNSSRYTIHFKELIIRILNRPIQLTSCWERRFESSQVALEERVIFKSIKIADSNDWKRKTL